MVATGVWEIGYASAPLPSGPEGGSRSRAMRRITTSFFPSCPDPAPNPCLTLYKSVLPDASAPAS